MIQTALPQSYCKRCGNVWDICFTCQKDMPKCACEDYKFCCHRSEEFYRKIKEKTRPRIKDGNPNPMNLGGGGFVGGVGTGFGTTKGAYTGFMT